MQELLVLRQWWDGPEFLRKTPEHWQKDKRQPQMSEDAQKETKTAKALSVTPAPSPTEGAAAMLANLDTDTESERFEKLDDLYKSFSSWTKLV